MKKYIYILLALLVSICLCFPKIKNISKKTIKKDRKVEAEKFVNKLDELGYYKYAEKEDVILLKNEMKEMIEEFGSQGTLITVWDEETMISRDYRYYLCDGEDVFEEGGIPDLLKDLEPTFRKLDFKINVDNFTEEWDDINKWLNTRIIINGTEYIIFEKFKGVGWGEAPMRIANALNKEMEKQGIKEKIYLIAGGNEGNLVFLTEELYQYMYKYFKDPIYKPLELNEWGKVMETEPMNF